MPRKILRIMIWANGAVSVLLVFSLLMAWTSAFYPYSLRLLWLVTQFGIKCVLLLPILGSVDISDFQPVIPAQAGIQRGWAVQVSLDAPIFSANLRQTASKFRMSTHPRLMYAPDGNLEPEKPR